MLINTMLLSSISLRVPSKVGTKPAFVAQTQKHLINILKGVWILDVHQWSTFPDFISLTFSYFFLI